MAHTVKVANTFSGPMDLLLYLVKRDEIDIHDIPVSHLTREYLAEINRMELVDVDAGGEFVAMASLLTEIKSRLLLPPVEVSEDSEDDEPYDPRDGLVQALLEYKQFKEIATELENMAEMHGGRFSRNAPIPEFPAIVHERSEELGALDLFSAFQIIARKYLNQTSPKEIVSDEIPTEVRIAQIEEVIAKRGRAEFTNLLSDNPTHGEMVGFFIAILELIRLRKVVAQQSVDFSEIYLVNRDASHDIGEQADDVDELEAVADNVQTEFATVIRHPHRLSFFLQLLPACPVEMLTAGNRFFLNLQASLAGKENKQTEIKLLDMGLFPRTGLVRKNYTKNKPLHDCFMETEVVAVQNNKEDCGTAQSYETASAQKSELVRSVLNQKRHLVLKVRDIFSGMKKVKSEETTLNTSKSGLIFTLGLTRSIQKYQQQTSMRISKTSLSLTLNFHTGKLGTYFLPIKSEAVVVNKTNDNTMSFEDRPHSVLSCQNILQKNITQPLCIQDLFSNRLQVTCSKFARKYVALGLFASRADITGLPLKKQSRDCFLRFPKRKDNLNQVVVGLANNRHQFLNLPVMKTPTMRSVQKGCLGLVGLSEGDAGSLEKSACVVAEKGFSDQIKSSDKVRDVAKSVRSVASIFGVASATTKVKKCKLENAKHAGFRFPARMCLQKQSMPVSKCIKRFP